MSAGGESGSLGAISWLGLRDEERKDTPLLYLAEVEGPAVEGMENGDNARSDGTDVRTTQVGFAFG
ncbi:hypothetical protein SCP_1403820 [Sparassis crispa]|uniref:Uncharacterized protein n=1 Tax=Sparassis crispa TaxID=139825 RepID=A0A401H3I5_9APHY|nr:hypothetical protein SCP_1403820 [Sparassis crispa]GBE88974.1 hypothetical protein SCP_1403820 [Sparassis crispa]